MLDWSTGNQDVDSDTALVDAVRRGEISAFDKLFLRHERRVLAVVRKITRNREDAEDVVQESFFRAYLHLDAFRGDARFSTWMTRIAMNQAFMFLRRKRHDPQSPSEAKIGGDPGLMSERELADNAPNPEQACWQRERQHFLSEAIGEIAPRMRDVVILRDIKEYSTKETAGILATTVPATKSNLSRGRRKLRFILENRQAARIYANR